MAHHSIHLPTIPGLNGNDLKAIDAISAVATDRYAATIQILLKEVRRLQETEKHLKNELHEVLDHASKTGRKRAPNKKKP